MNLVNELQVSAEQDDVLTVLRKTKRLASKLDRQDIAVWLQAEQNGYPDEMPVPEYREIVTSFAFDTNGYIPAGYGRIVKGVIDLPSLGVPLPFAAKQSISVILNWIDRVKTGGRLFMPLDDTDFAQTVRRAYGFNPQFAHQIILLFSLNESQILAIPEQIKDKVLDWACDLERAGVTGEGLTFSTKEKQIAHSVTFNIDNSTIGQLTNSGTNQRSGK